MSYEIPEYPMLDLRKPECTEGPWITDERCQGEVTSGCFAHYNFVRETLSNCVLQDVEMELCEVHDSVISGNTRLSLCNVSGVIAHSCTFSMCDMLLNDVIDSDVQNCRVKGGTAYKSFFDECDIQQVRSVDPRTATRQHTSKERFLYPLGWRYGQILPVGYQLHGFQPSSLTMLYDVYRAVATPKMTELAEWLYPWYLEMSRSGNVTHNQLQLAFNELVNTNGVRKLMREYYAQMV